MNFQSILLNDRLRVKLVGVLLAAILFFYAAFRPFHMSSYSLGQLLFVLLGYAMLSLDVLAAYLILFPKYFQRSFAKMVSKKKGRMTYASMVVVTIGSTFFLFKVLFGFYDLSLEHFGKGLMAMGALSVFPLSFIGYFDRESETVPKSDPPKLPEVPRLFLDEKFKDIALDELVFIYSDRNYVVWVCSIGEVKKEFRIRETLSSVFARLQVHIEVKQCHRAYLVNSDYIESTGKSGRAFCLELKAPFGPIPLSRNHLDSFKLIPKDCQNSLTQNDPQDG